MPEYSGYSGYLRILLALLVLTGGCQYPKDMEGSLDAIRGGTLHVGLIENPPWVMRTGDQPGGLEPELLLSIAETLDADVRWHWGAESELLKALGQHQIHIVAGGLVQRPHLEKEAALTHPYLVSEKRIGFPSGADIPDTLRGLRVGILRKQGLHHFLVDEGAHPTFIARLDDPQLPVASDDWQLAARDLAPGPWVLTQEKHVLALSKGENAWLMEVERAFGQTDSLMSRLVALAREAR